MKLAAGPGAPTALARRYVRLVTGFSVGVGLGLAFFLGKINVPGFSALLEVIPFQLQDVLVPLSTFLVGLIAVLVQFYAGEAIAAGRIRALFGAGLAAVLAGFILFTVFDTLFVSWQKMGSKNVGVVVAESRLETCACGAESELNDKSCIKQLTLSEDELATCWGGPSLQRREVALSFGYLLLIGGFAWLVGLLLMQQEARRHRRATAAARTPRKRAAHRRSAPL